MATIAVGDIHGNLPGVQDLLDQIRGEVHAGDTVVFLGDYIDRGADSKGCIDALIAFRDETDAEVVFLCGNHEDWFLETLRDYATHSWLLGMDGYVTIRSYSKDAEQAIRDAASASRGAVYGDGFPLPYDLFFAAVPRAHLRFFQELRLYHQNSDGIYVHAGIDSRVPLDKQTRDAVLFGWGDGGFPRKYTGKDIVLYGHRNNAELDESGWPHPRREGLTIGLDSSRHRVVTAMRLPDQRVFQSRRYD